MTRRGAGAWQRSTAYDRDRRRVERLVTLTGTQRLAFNAYDVARTARQHRELRLEQSGELHRHLRDLRVTLATPVGPELITLRTPPATRRRSGTERPSRVPEAPQLSPRPERRVRRWVLTSRLDEWEKSGGGCTDAEKVYLAVWVASAALATRTVPTIAVTRVLRVIPELRLVDFTQTSVLLTRLAERTRPLVRVVKSATEHWVAWEPTGEAPEHPLLTKWTEEVRRLAEDGGTLPLTEHATRNVATRELLRRTIQSTRSKDWPDGRPVSARDVRLYAATDEVARDLLLRVTANGGSLGRALHEASRQRKGASARRGVHRIVGPAGERHIRYDVPAVPGHEIRLQAANLETLRPLVSQDRLLQMDEERRRAESLGRAVGPPDVPCLSLRYHIAQKWHGMTRAMPNGGPNDRFRDAVDLLLLRDLVMSAELPAVREACEETFRVRAEHAWPPPLALPAHWERPFAAMAIGLDLPTTTLPEAERELQEFLARIVAVADGAADAEATFDLPAV